MRHKTRVNFPANPPYSRISVEIIQFGMQILKHLGELQAMFLLRLLQRIRLQQTNNRSCSWNIALRRKDFDWIYYLFFATPSFHRNIKERPSTQQKGGKLHWVLLLNAFTVCIKIKNRFKTIIFRWIFKAQDFHINSLHLHI